METKEFQQKCAKIVSDIDNRYNIKRDLHFSFTQLMEEIGELAKDINLPKLRNKEIDKENLKGEFADVILQLSILAKMLDVDFEEAVKSKIKILKERHHL
jgi:NTP pyrophosphatase (non-canonical NTP hydrolase)